MSDLKQLFSKRLNLFLKEVGKYGRLIFNDHFSIILFVLLGFGALYYQQQLNYLQTLETNQYKLPLITLLAALISLVLLLGNPQWLVKDPDKSFLFARGKEWLSYWRKGILTGFILPAVLFSLLIILAVPLLEFVTAWTLNEAWIIILLAVLFQLNVYLRQYLRVLQPATNNGSVKIYLGLRFFIYLWLSFYLSRPYQFLILLGGLLFEAGLTFYIFQQTKKNAINFEFALTQSLQQESRFYKTVSAFADVPQVTPSIRRRKALDPLIEKLSQPLMNRYGFLFLRVLFRNDAYSGIWIRIGLFISIVIAVTADAPIISFAAGTLGYLMTVIQLLPVLNIYHAYPQARIYSVQDTGQKVYSFRFTLFLIFAVQTLFYLAALVISRTLIMEIVYILIGWILVMLFCNFIYFNFWTKKHLKQ